MIFLEVMAALLAIVTAGAFFAGVAAIPFWAVAHLFRALKLKSLRDSKRREAIRSLGRAGGLGWCGSCVGYLICPYCFPKHYNGSWRTTR